MITIKIFSCNIFRQNRQPNSSFPQGTWLWYLVSHWGVIFSFFSFREDVDLVCGLRLVFGFLLSTVVFHGCVLRGGEVFQQWTHYQLGSTHFPPLRSADLHIRVTRYLLYIVFLLFVWVLAIYFFRLPMERREGMGPPKPVEGPFRDCLPQAEWSAQSEGGGRWRELSPGQSTCKVLVWNAHLSWSYCHCRPAPFGSVWWWFWSVHPQGLL